MESPKKSRIKDHCFISLICIACMPNKILQAILLCALSTYLVCLFAVICFHPIDCVLWNKLGKFLFDCTIPLAIQKFLRNWLTIHVKFKVADLLKVSTDVCSLYSCFYHHVTNALRHYNQGLNKSIMCRKGNLPLLQRVKDT